MNRDEKVKLIASLIAAGRIDEAVKETMDALHEISDCASCESSRSAARLILGDQLMPVDIENDVASFECQGCREVCCMEQSPELNIYDWIRIQLYVARLDQSNDALNTSLLHKVVEIVPGVPPRMKAPSRSLNGMISGCPFLVLASGWPEGLSKDRYTHGEMIHAFNNPGDFESPAGAMVGACQIHAVRPTACKLYPLGRSGDWKPNAGHMQFEYFLSGGCDCPGPKHGNEKTWLEHLERGGFNKEESEDSANWSVKIKSLVIKNKDKLNSENLRTLAMLMFPTLTRGEPLPKPEDDHQFVAEAMSRMIHVIGIWFEEGTPVQPVDEMMAIPWHIIMHGPLK